MPREMYEIVASAARYWFLFLMVLIVLRSFLWYRKDQKQHKKQRKLMPDAGYIGEMVVIQSDSEELAPGDTLPVSWEGVLGFTRINDLCIPADGVANKHCLFRFEEKVGLFLEPCGRQSIQVDGQEYVGHKDTAYMSHGSFLKIGDTVLRLRMFSGYETRPVPRSAPVADGGQRNAQYAPYPAPTPEQLAGWQQMMQQQMAQQQMAQRQLMAQQQLAQQQMAYQQQMMQQMAWARQNQPMPQPPAEAPQEEYDGQLEFDHQQTFYPPVMDDDEDFADELPEEDIYAAYRRPVPAPKPEPRRQTRYDNRYYDELLDEDMTDAAIPPRSQYVGEDDAKAMKQEVWDRMLGGDGR